MIVWRLAPVLLSDPMAALAVAQEMNSWRHPALPVTIEAPTAWGANSWHHDPGVFEVAAPDGSVRSLLSFTDTEQSADRYLAKMVNMKPLEPTGPVRQTGIGGRAAWRVEAVGSEQGWDGIAETFAVMNVGAGFPGEGTLVLQVWCAADRADEFGPMIDRIVGSLRIETDAN